MPTPILQELGVDWKVHTPGLLREILCNNETQILKRPIQIFAGLLVKVGEEAIRINDPKLNALMCRLAIYSCADPESPDFDKEKCLQVYLLAKMEEK